MKVKKRTRRWKKSAGFSTLDDVRRESLLWWTCLYSGGTGTNILAKSPASKSILEEGAVRNRVVHDMAVSRCWRTEASARSRDQACPGFLPIGGKFSNDGFSSSAGRLIIHRLRQIPFVGRCLLLWWYIFPARLLDSDFEYMWSTPRWLKINIVFSAVVILKVQCTNIVKDWKLGWSYLALKPHWAVNKRSPWLSSGSLHDSI